MTADFRQRLASYATETSRRRRVQAEFPESFTDCPACCEGAPAWCSHCLGTGLVTKATARTFSEPKSDRQTERAA